MIRDFKTTFYNLSKEMGQGKDFNLICDNSPELDQGIVKLTSICPSRQSIKCLIEALKKSQDVFELDLSESLLDFEDLELILGALSCPNDLPSSINTLKLDSLNFTYDKCLSLSKMLRENRFIQRLSLKWCQIGQDSESAKALFTTLAANDSLEYLDLSNNGIMSSLGKSFALICLKSNISLRNIDLSWNKLGDQAGTCLVDVLKINKTVQVLKLDGNDISEVISSSIGSQISHNVQLHLKQAELVSKTSALHNQLEVTKDKLSREIKDLKRNYQNLEINGVEQQDNLLFELGKLGQQLTERNQEFGALTEKWSLTCKALKVAEEKIAHLELVDKQRSGHFAQLQQQCAEHEQALRLEWLKSEEESKLTIQTLSQERHESNLKAAQVKNNYIVI